MERKTTFNYSAELVPQTCFSIQHICYLSIGIQTSTSRTRDQHHQAWMERAQGNEGEREREREGRRERVTQ